MKCFLFGSDITKSYIPFLRLFYLMVFCFKLQSRFIIHEREEMYERGWFLLLYVSTCFLCLQSRSDQVFIIFKVQIELYTSATFYCFTVKTKHILSSDELSIISLPYSGTWLGIILWWIPHMTRHPDRSTRVCLRLYISKLLHLFWYSLPKE